jgi:hypothetical protein
MTDRNNFHHRVQVDKYHTFLTNPANNREGDVHKDEHEHANALMVMSNKSPIKGRLACCGGDSRDDSGGDSGGNSWW